LLVDGRKETWETEAQAAEDAESPYAWRRGGAAVFDVVLEVGIEEVLDVLDENFGAVA